MFHIRSSKFRHVFGSAAKKEQCYEGIGITRNAAHDSNFCAVNPKFIAVVVESTGGGAFIVQPLLQTGRVCISVVPKVLGHRGPVTDIKWSPFNDNIIASCSDDTTIKVWQIPSSGLVCNLSSWLADMKGHCKRVNYIEWHPTAEHILLSAGSDFKCMLWNSRTEECLRVFSCHLDSVYSISWNRDGSLFATTCKDKMIRIIDPRRDIVVSEGKGHAGSKACKVVFIDKKRVFTCGFSTMSERQFALWNIDNLSKPLRLENIDVSSGLIIPFYDYDTKVMFLAGKGDGNIRYYEIVDEAPYVHFLSQYLSGCPQRGLGQMPKRGVNTSKCEIVRFYKLHSLKDLCEPISMIVPRKASTFQEDLYPPTAGPCRSLTADEWLSGRNKDPLLIPMKDNIPATYTEDPTACHTANVSKSTTTCSRNSGATSLCTDSTLVEKVRRGSHRSTNGSSVINGPTAQREQPSNGTPIYDNKSTTAHNDLTSSQSCARVDEEVLSSGYIAINNSNNSNRKVISTSVSSSDRQNTDCGTKSNGFSQNGDIPQSDTELRKAFITQSEDIADLKEQLSIKDSKIHQLEEEIRILKLSVSAHELNAVTKC